ncbi:MAG: aldehyde dehydrogenase (NADP(+)) [Flavobacteriaceae bacterium]|nr:aldehyde dehydrogenase (NADP(+)) [Flavobacteriaceae bacterium]MCY4266425.1 aldehyde dehydrogenase (NADP(+)) [Flavobacteriaceae bacterium]MCY4299189.1 aldehyde dehydrogenase (NADP(+)) [Flavobacteriaceae bacterium]
MIQGLSQVGGQYVSSSPSKSFYQWKNTLFFEADSNQINHALDQAELAYATLKMLAPSDIAQLLECIIVELESHQPLILETYQAESHFPKGRADGEFARTIGQIRTFIKLLEKGQHLQAKIDDATEISPDLRKVLMPIGPIAVFGASNFPLAFSAAGGDTISALAAGCSVIIKGHPYHAATSELVATCMIQAVEKSKLHCGTISHLHGSSHHIGQYLIKHPKLKGVGFTGSFSGGKALYDLAQKRTVPIPVFAEMGSVNPVIILKEYLDTDKELAQKLADSVLLGSGQFCTNPGLIFIESKDDNHPLVRDLISRIIQSEVGPMVHENILKSYTDQITQLSKYSPQLKVYQSNVSCATCGVIKINDLIDVSSLTHEIFGPYTLLVLFDGVDEFLKMIPKLKGQLTMTILGNPSEVKKVSEISQAVNHLAGRILFNGVPTGVAVQSTMTHGGPFPATTDSRFTSVGTDAIYRWLRPITFQDCPDALLPDALKRMNPLKLTREVNGTWGIH